MIRRAQRGKIGPKCLPMHWTEGEGEEGRVSLFLVFVSDEIKPEKAAVLQKAFL